MGIILVYTSSASFKIEKIFAKENIEHKLIPTPRQYSSDCGISIKFFGSDIEIIKETDGEYVPSMKFYNSDGEYTGVSFNALPGGHEFNSFVLALYNIAGPGQPLESAVIDQIKNIDKKVNIKVIISLECTMCPDLVVASHRLALLNKNIEAQTFDVYYFPSFREKYKIMSVPCLVLNDEIVEFGKKTIPELISLINEKLV